MPLVNAHTWTAKSGHKIEGDFVKLENEIVSIGLSDGKTANIEIDQLCDEDKQFIKSQTEKNDPPFVIKDSPFQQEQETKTATEIEPAIDNNITNNNINTVINNTVVNQSTPFAVLQSEAEKNNPDAICWLALCYDDGLKGCSIDKPKAKELWQKAAQYANTDSAAAQFCRGICNHYGYGIPKNPTEAVKWYRKSADQGFAPACCNLGDCYYQGIGVEQNKTESLEWFRKAAEQGDASAQYNIANFYFKGDGVPENKPEAIKWYIKSAEQGIVQAQYRLYIFYWNGDGTPKNETEAVKWLSKAADNGHDDAKKLLATLETIQKNEKEQNESTPNIPTSSNTNNENIDNNPQEIVTAESAPPAELASIQLRGEYPVFSHDNKFIATSDMQGQGGAKTITTIWDLTTGKKKFVLNGEQPAFSPDGNYIVTFFQDWETQKFINRERRMRSQGKIPKDVVPGSLEWLKIWDAKTGREIKELEVESTYFAFFNNGKSIMLDDYLWSFPNGKRERKLNPDEIEYTRKAKEPRSDGSIDKLPTKFFSNDDKLFVTEDYQKYISQLYDNTTGKFLYSFKGITPRFSPDGKTITTEEGKFNDKTSYLWDTETGKILYKFQGTNPVFSPNSQLIATHEEENITRLYNLNPQSLDLPSFLSSDESITSILNEQTEPQQLNQSQRQQGQQRRRVDVNDVERAVDTGLRIYDTIRRFSR
ncbi:MAG: hypothetical protein LBJ67_08840 [Planctomycetaceae bacterium]|nr:hypothetical protein [Planctomycetaceae bacterium]